MAFETNLAYIKLIAESPSRHPHYQHLYAEALASPYLISESADSDELGWLQQNMTSSLEIVAKLSRNYPSCPGYRFTAADVSHKLAIIATRCGNADSVEPYFKTALDRQNELVARFPRNPRYKLWRSVFQASYARYLAASGRIAESNEAQQVSQAEAETIAESAVHPKVLETAFQFIAGGEQRMSPANDDG